MEGTLVDGDRAINCIDIYNGFTVGINLLNMVLKLADNDNYVAQGNVGQEPLFKLGTIFLRLLERFFLVYTPHQQRYDSVEG